MRQRHVLSALSFHLCYSLHSFVFIRPKMLKLITCLVMLFFLTLYWTRNICAGILRLTQTRNCAGRVHFWDNAAYLVPIRSIYAIHYSLLFIRPKMLKLITCLVILLFLTLYWTWSISAGILRLTQTRNCAGRVHLWHNATYLVPICSIYAIHYTLLYLLDLKC